MSVVFHELKVSAVTRETSECNSFELSVPAELEDAYLGLGIFHYYADVLPSVLKVLGMLVGMGGDAERGLAEIQRAVRNGDLVNVEGRFFLAEIYTTFEEDHWTAYGYSRGLRDEFHLQWGLRRLALRLDQAGVAHRHVEHDGGHFGLDARWDALLSDLIAALGAS